MLTDKLPCILVGLVQAIFYDEWYRAWDRLVIEYRCGKHEDATNLFPSRLTYHWTC